MTVGLAVFVEKTLATCTDAKMTPEKAAKLELGDGGITRLNQSCASLGQIALTTCTRPTQVIHYYRDKYSDRYMADCVKDGGTWAKNNSADAELERSKQELAKLQGGRL